jgi:hypothetical protein
MESKRRAYNFVDLTGLKFRRLVVTPEFEIVEHVDKNGTTKKSTYWVCKCDCGKTCKVSSRRLRSNKTSSCGCLRFDNKTPENRIVPNNGATQNNIIHSYKKAAIRRGIEFKLNSEEFFDLVYKNCYYCNTVPSNLKKCQNHTNLDIFYSGIDRVDNTKGYELGNCVPCCKVCNRAKDVMGQEEFLDWIGRVYNHAVRKVSNPV